MAAEYIGASAGESAGPGGFASLPPDAGAFAELVASLLRAGYGVRTRVRGSSMHPTIRLGETVVVAPSAPAAIRRGDILLYRLEGGVVAHRVVNVARGGGGEAAFTLRGDAPWMTDERVRAEQALGRVVFVERGGRLVPLATRRARLFQRLAAQVYRCKCWCSHQASGMAAFRRRGSRSFPADRF